MKRVIIGLLLISGASYLGWRVFDNSVVSGSMGQERSAGSPQAPSVPDDIIIGRQMADQAVSPKDQNARQILFGDLHVHSTYSTDAFLWALPLNHGKGVHPVADACDYARYCSAIDFWSITDHAEAGTPLRWQRTKEAIRQCQAKSADQSNPDLVSMLGFEWTQVGALPNEHFGHKNVIFKGLSDDEVAARPIAAQGLATNALRTSASGFPSIVPLSDFKNRQNYYDFNSFISNIQAVAACDPNLPSNELPLDCYESAKYPGDLIRRLEEQGLDPLIIPHGSSWGFYTPPGTTWDKQLAPEHRPEKFSLIEIYSGHGNSEEYRDYVNVIVEDEEATVASCAPITETFTPPCQRAGQLIQQRCLEEGKSQDECARQAETARHAAANMGIPFHLVVGGESPEDWLEAGQCTDCNLASFNHRPLTSVQHGLAISRFEDQQAEPTRFNWGFIASSDNHRARPGTGYKEVARHLTTEAGGVIDPKYRPIFFLDEPDADSTIHAKTREELQALAGFQVTEMERQSSFWQTGGLAAVHTDGRSREQIWQALQRRETYATSGPRMLLWFNRIDEQNISVPMGSTIETNTSGKFVVTAVGSYKQKPGCPDYAVSALGEQRITELCSDECYNPSDQRNLIERIEIVRIRPQIVPDEPVKGLIEDVFLSFDCPAQESGCTVEFEDPSFASGQRDALYYARAIQEPRPTINGEPIRCERDEEGNCIKATLCLGDYRTPADDDCLSSTEVRAWSSPIYLNYSEPRAAL